MKRTILTVIISVIFSIITTPFAQAQSVLYFQARIHNEQLAEEAIEFLHCISRKAEIAWELSEASAKNTLSLKEDSGKLMGHLRLGERREEVNFALGEGLDRCEQLFPDPAKDQVEASLPLESVATPKSAKTWLTVGTIAVAIGLGLFLWQQKGPDHRALELR
jgi:hypothetical protein